MDADSVTRPVAGSRQSSLYPTEAAPIARTATLDDEPREEEDLTLLDLAIPLAERWRLLLVGPLLAGLVALGITYIIRPTFTSRTVFLPPQQQQSAAAMALANLGSLAGLAGTGLNLKTPGDQYVALMQSTTVADRIIDQFKLMQVYDVKFREVARKKLDDKVQISVGKKDGLITVEVDDEDPQRSAEMANRFVEELRRLTDRLALTEAQQRRLFFEAQMQQTRDRMTKAQQALQASGFDQGAIKAEPRSAAEGYARLMAERTAAEVRLQAMRKSLVDSSPEVQQQLATIAALRSQLARLEANTPRQNSDDYIGKYRAFKYEETLFDLFSKQYELARVDESREGALIQVVDTAMPPERRSRPKRALTAVATTVGAFVALACYVLIRRAWRNSATSPANADRIARLRAAWRGGR